MACSSCARKASLRNKRLRASFLNDPKRLQRLLREAERKNQVDKIQELKNKLNNLSNPNKSDE